MIDRERLIEAKAVAIVISKTIDHKFGEYDETTIDDAMQILTELAEQYLDGKISEMASEEELLVIINRYIPLGNAKYRSSLAEALVGRVPKDVGAGKCEICDGLGGKWINNDYPDYVGIFMPCDKCNGTGTQATGGVTR